MTLIRLAEALRAVSTSPAMPDFETYVRAVEALRSSAIRTNPPANVLVRTMTASRRLHDGLLHDVSAIELLTALCSFTDDYQGAPPTHLFEVDVALELLEALEQHSNLIVTDQLEVALALTCGQLFRSVMALHTATRVLARGRDTRLHPRFAIPLDERIRRGRAIAAFHPSDSRGGDPLGDTYHFWANVAGGLFGMNEERSNGPRAVVTGMLYAGPWLMRNIRAGVFARTLFYGDHARVDRLGLRVGRSLGRARLAASLDRTRASDNQPHGSTSADGRAVRALVGRQRGSLTCDSPSKRRH